MNEAEIILAQLGGSRMIAMTGAKNLINHGTAISMTLPASLTKGRVNRLMITLTPDDLYHIQVGKYRNLEVRWTDERNGIYAENLRETFTALTGLDTHL